jgi:hypothetical protein
VYVPSLEYEFGARYWLSTGKFQWDNKIPGGFNVSRLTYDDLTGHSGELFARVDGANNIFVKAQAGIGVIPDGKQNDEDWGIFQAISYSNTRSNEQDGKLSYGTIDLGYDIWRGLGYKVGPFLGYNYYTQRSDTRGCVQIANPNFPCLAPGDNRLVGTQDVEWNSMRIGLSGEFVLPYGLRLSADAAYLPIASFTGRDNHLLRDTTTYFDQTANGEGVQIEAMLAYDFSNRLSIGVGGRYWAMWGDGDFTCTGCNTVGVTSPPFPERISTQRFGLLLQGSYKVSDTIVAIEPFK